MDFQSAITCFLIFLVVFLLLYHYHIHGTKSGRLIDDIPGRKWYPVIGNLLDLVVPLEDLWHVLRRAARDYYPIYKFWLGGWPVVFIQHPDDVEILLASNKNISKSIFYDYLRPWFNDGLLTSTGDKWKTRRKMITPAFHLNSLREYAGGILKHSDKLIATLKDECKSGHIDKELLSLCSTYTLESICEMAMGTTLDEKNPEQDSYRQSVYDFGELAFYRMVRPWLKNGCIFSLTSKGREQTRALKILHEFTTKIIKERQKYHEDTGGKYLDEFSSSPSDSTVQSDDYYVKKKRLAFLDLLIAAAKRGAGLSDLDIREEVDTFVFEGHDTTAVGLIFSVLLLAENKEAQARARAEVDEILTESDGKITMAESSRFTYLECCIKEALRLYPSVPIISRKITHDLQLTKHLIPKETIVNIHIYNVHRDPHYWPRPNIYDPDRFSPENVQGRHPFSYIPFSAGPRNCIGQKFAMFALKSVLAKLLHNFYLEPLEPTACIPLVPDLVIRSAEPMFARFVPIVK